MYFRLDVDPGAFNTYLREESNEHLTLIEGSRVPEEEPLELPFRFTMSTDRDLRGNIKKSSTICSYVPDKCLMHLSLIRTLRMAGVDNLQVFPAEIADPETGRTITDYVVVNVIGLVSCANIDKSNAEPLASVHFFHELVLDPTRVMDLLLFRLAESRIDIILHERVALAIRAGDFTGLVLEPLAEAPTI